MIKQRTASPIPGDLIDHSTVIKTYLTAYHSAVYEAKIVKKVINLPLMQHFAECF